MCILAALILPVRGSANAPIQNSHIVEEHVGAVARATAEFRPLRPTAFRIVLGAPGGVNAAIENPVHGFAGHLSFGESLAKIGTKHTVLAWLFSNRGRQNAKEE